MNANSGYPHSSVRSGCEVRRACDTNDGWRRFKTNLDIMTEEILSLPCQRRNERTLTWYYAPVCENSHHSSRECLCSPSRLFFRTPDKRLMRLTVPSYREFVTAIIDNEYKSRTRKVSILLKFETAITLSTYCPVNKTRCQCNPISSPEIYST